MIVEVPVGNVVGLGVAPTGVGGCQLPLQSPNNTAVKFAPLTGPPSPEIEIWPAVQLVGPGWGYTLV